MSYIFFKTLQSTLYSYTMLHISDVEELSFKISYKNQDFFEIVDKEWIVIFYKMY